VELERTTLTSLDAFALAQESLAKNPQGYEAVQLALTLLSQSEAKKVKPAEARSWADRAVSAAGLYGPRWQRDVLLMVAEVLSDEKGFEAIGLQYAQRAARRLEPTEAPAAQKRVLDELAGALEKAGKAEEAKKVQARVAKLDFRLKPKPFAGRKGKSKRVVLVELFTGAQCPPCVAADLGFDALGKTFKPSEAVLLQYHLHIPQPDALTNPDGEARSRFYDEAVRGTPTILFNGKAAAGGGGGQGDAPEKYEEYVGVIEPLLEKEAKAEVKLSAVRKGDKVEIQAEVGKVAEAGDDVRLRLALVEEEVAYKGTNGLATHHQVVRSMPGGEAGTQVDKEKGAKKAVTVDLAELRKKLKDYLDKYPKKFPVKGQPLELKKLAVVAFVQDDKTGEVLQAARVELKDAPAAEEKE
jgi:hypothetical protein